jgi:hypothetical protein
MSNFKRDKLSFDIILGGVQMEYIEDDLTNPI